LPSLALAQSRTIFIPPTSDGFEVYLTAAMSKKKVPVAVSTVEEKADLVLKASEVEVHKVGTGTKVLNCLFAYCGGNADKGTTSVQLINKDGLVIWSYSVNKGRGEKNKQSLAEAIAKHLNDDYLKKNPAGSK
jgi:hypothetical protein